MKHDYSHFRESSHDFVGRWFKASHRNVGEHEYKFMGARKADNQPLVKRDDGSLFAVDWNWFDSEQTGRKIEWLEVTA